jgi:hypothetical protein
MLGSLPGRVEDVKHVKHVKRTPTFECGRPKTDRVSLVYRTCQNVSMG